MPAKAAPAYRSFYIVVEMSWIDPDQKLHFAIEHPAVDGRFTICGAGEFDHVCRFIKATEALSGKERKLCATCRAAANGNR